MKRLLRIFSIVTVLLAGFYSQVNAQNGTGLPEHWQNIPEIPIGTVDAAAFSIGTRAYVIGGDTSGEYGVRKKYSHAVHRYDSATNSWSQLSNFPGVARVGAVAFAVGGYGYYGLGQDSTGFEEFGQFRRNFLRDWWRFDPFSGTWTRLNDFPNRGRSYASSFVLRNTGGTLAPGFAFGMTDNGMNGTDYIDSLYFYNFTNDTWVGIQTDAPGRANGAVIPTDSGRLMMGLGDKGIYNEYLTDWWEYNVPAGVFARRADFPSEEVPPKGKVNAGTFSYANFCYVVCGYSGVWSKRFYEYDRLDDIWQQYPDYKDSGRANGVSWMIGSMGYYGAGYRPLSEELATFSKFYIDTATIRISAFFPDTICASTELILGWSAGKTFAMGNTLRVQMSDSLGFYTWPPTPASIIGTFPATGNNGSITVKLPELAIEGRKYRIRLISDNPNLLGRSSPTFFLKSNPLFSYRPTVHPLYDTACENSDFLIPQFVKGTTRSSGKLSYRWQYNGVDISDGINGNGVGYSGTKTDSLKIVRAQVSMSGSYRLIAMGDCYPDTSLPFEIVVDVFPPPTISFQPADTISGSPKRTPICEFTNYKLKVNASGKNVNYQWYRNGDTLAAKGNIVGSKSNELSFTPILGNDSGWYKLKVYEDCGSYVFTDSFFVEVRQIARIVTNPKNVSNAYEGTTAGFKVIATGFDLKYRWKSGMDPIINGGRYSGADSDSLIISNIQANDVAFYSVEVTGGCPPKTTSNLAILDIILSPKIDRQPKDTLYICEGSSGSINILASGNNLTFQWKRNSTPTYPGSSNVIYGNFSGINSRTLEFTNITSAQTGYYYNEVGNGIGAPALSNFSYIKVNPIPVKPKVGFSLSGGGQMFANGTADTYLWFYNGRYMAQYTGMKQFVLPDSLKDGDWTLRVLINDCISPVSDIFVLGIDEVNEPVNLDIYPNPTVDVINFELVNAGGSPVDIKVYDLTGKLVATYNDVDPDKVELNVSALKPGMYVVHARTEDRVFTGKFIKQ